ncbi:MAG: hypothetical protein GXO73_02050 [Calditrichaeota bacterium]|nr:hypothetical protein [Calditrichota bacterium]
MGVGRTAIGKGEIMHENGTGNPGRDGLETLLNRVAEVEALFVLVRRIVPFVEDLARFVHDVAPMLRKASQSLRESSNKMPRAAEHLSNVTEATELATSEVLDRLDRILQELSNIDTFADSYASFRRSFAASCRRLDQIAESLQDGRMLAAEGALAISRLVTRLQERATELPPPATLRHESQTIRDEAYEIMTALQVQDITAQQLMAAYELIRSVQEKINSLLNDLFNVDGELVPKRKVAYDANATFSLHNSGARQARVDAVLENAAARTAPAGQENERAETQADVDEILRQMARS